jgi:hypothetical protein
MTKQLLKQWPLLVRIKACYFGVYQELGKLGVPSDQIRRWRTHNVLWTVCTRRLKVAAYQGKDMGGYIPWYLAHKIVLRNFCIYNDTHTFFLGQVTIARAGNDSTTGVTAPLPPYTQPELAPESTREEPVNKSFLLKASQSASEPTCHAQRTSPKEDTCRIFLNYLRNLCH